MGYNNRTGFMLSDHEARPTVGKRHRNQKAQAGIQASLTLRDLMLPFPVEWAGQRSQFGVAG